MGRYILILLDVPKLISKKKMEGCFSLHPFIPKTKGLGVPRKLSRDPILQRGRRLGKRWL